MTQFGNDLRVKLAENHMKHSDLAEYLGVNKWSVSNWVNGKASPRPRAFNMICDLFEMSREKYTAERNPKKVFTPKPQVDPKVKERESNWKNPYTLKDAVNDEKRTVFRVPEVNAKDLTPDELEKVKKMAQDIGKTILPAKSVNADIIALQERLETAIKRWHDAEEQITKLTEKAQGLKEAEMKIAILTKKVEDLKESVQLLQFTKRRMDEMNDKINYMRGRVDSVAGYSSTVLLPEEEKKSWWKRLWE